MIYMTPEIEIIEFGETDVMILSTESMSFSAQYDDYTNEDPDHVIIL
ncbi:MAG: hypothetical protein IKR73_00295 [Oscillospiraceae bacterium]|nr:hypothetical protein [Oscillospiraceae bacterium]